MEEVTTQRKLPTPYLLAIGNIEMPSQIFLVTDCTIVMELTMESCVMVLFSSYFTFNICYPKGCSNVMTVLEIIFTGAPVSKLSPSSRLTFSNIESC